MADLTVIVVNYNTAKEVKRCVESLLAQQGITLEIIVIDNASHDHSSEILKSFEDKIRLILSDQNNGFGKANNLAFNINTSDYILFLNPDAYFETENGLKTMFDYMLQHPECGILTAKMLDEKRIKETFPKYIYPGEKRFPSHFKSLPGKVAWVLGANMLMPSHLFKEIGGFDERFFLYAEDVDLCLRVRQKGYEVLQLDSVTVIHVGGASEKISYDKSLRKTRGLCIFYQKYFTSTERRFLIKKDLFRVRVRLYFYWVMKCFTKESKVLDKYSHYKAIFDVFKKALTQALI